MQPAPTRLTEEQVSGIDVPVQVFFVGRSVMHDAGAAADEAERILTQGTVVLKSEGSHAIHGECFDELSARILDFAR